MVVSQEEIASRVGAEILAQGGNAIDAAVATGFAMAVTLPRAGNIGGGGFMMIYLAEERRMVAIDYREMAPAAAHRDMYLGADGEVDPQKSRYSVLASGVPGTVAGLLHAQQKYGRLSRQAVLKPAILLAQKGFPVPLSLARDLERAETVLKKHPAAAEYFYGADGQPPQWGEVWRNADLAATLKRISKDGTQGFYEGKTADLIVAEMARMDGLITRQDLANYRAVERTAVCGEYRDYNVCTMPPPSSGGVHLLQMLNILKGWDLPAMGHNSAAYIHHLAETMRRAYADRSEYLGDPDYWDVPVQELLSEEYAAELRNQIDPDRATPSTQVKPGLDLPYESKQTTHFSTWDSDGNVVSNTYTLNFSFGSGIAVGGAGFLLNNEMDDFSAKPGVPNAFGLIGNEANAIAGGKRPLSSMTPTIVLKDGEAVLATGSPGGSTIITVVLQMILNYAEFGMNPAEATAAPRIHHQWMPDRLSVESGISSDTLEILRKMGHELRQNWVLGSTQSIGRSQGYLAGAADPRRMGAAAIPQPESEAANKAK